jgi:hypothetical protein
VNSGGFRRGSAGGLGLHTICIHADQSNQLKNESESVKFGLAVLGKLVASVFDLTTFHNVHIIVCPVGRFSMYIPNEMHVPAEAETHRLANKDGE